MSQDEQKAARVMHEEYNETVTGWVHESIAATLDDLTACVDKYYKMSPERFEDVHNPFVIADFGCATGASSIVPLKALITAVRNIQPLMPVQVFLNDLPENRFDLAFQSVQQALSDFQDLFIMAAGKDFTVQVFPSNSIDIAFSSLTAMILPTAAAQLKDNVFFLANEENVKTEDGQKWVEGFKKHFSAFLSSRTKELKKNGILFVTTIINTNPLKSYQAKESQFFHEVASGLLHDILKKYGIEDKIHHCMKTTVSMFKSHYEEVCEGLSDKLNVLSLNSYDVIDIFYREYEKTLDKNALGTGVASYMKGWWCDVLEGGLQQQGVSKEITSKVATELFDQLLPTFISEKIDTYPEYYETLALKVQKI